MNDRMPHRTAMLAVIGGFALAVLGCRPTGTNSESKAGNAEANLENELNPALTAIPQHAADFVAPPPWNPNTIFPVPVRSWLPPAEILEKAGTLPGAQPFAMSPPYSLPESPLPAPDATLPEPLILPVPALAFAISPDPARVTVWIATSPAPETRGRPPAWDRPQLATDPTSDMTRAIPAAAPTGLRETPPPFLRLTIPDPFEQIAIAELRTPPPEIDSPITPFTRPANLWPASPAPAK